MARKGSVIDFKGTEEEFERLLDELYRDESNAKVLDYYEGN